MTRFTITNNAGSLGDWLSLTPVLRAKRDEMWKGTDKDWQKDYPQHWPIYPSDLPLVIAQDSPHTRRFATLYKGLAEVQFVHPNDRVAPTPADELPACFSRRILRAHCVSDSVSAIPRIELDENEVAVAHMNLSWFHKPIVFSHAVGGADESQPESALCNYRKMPRTLATQIVKDLIAAGHDVIRFGTTATRCPIPGVTNLTDLPLRTVAAYYAAIGEYVGGDTGDHHLMLACGGRSTCYVPPSAWHYRHDLHLYQPTDWAMGEHPRETYIQFTHST